MPITITNNSIEEQYITVRLAEHVDHFVTPEIHWDGTSKNGCQTQPRAAVKSKTYADKKVGNLQSKFSYSGSSHTYGYRAKPAIPQSNCNRLPSAYLLTVHRMPGLSGI